MSANIKYYLNKFVGSRKFLTMVFGNYEILQIEGVPDYYAILLTCVYIVAQSVEDAVKRWRDGS